MAQSIGVSSPRVLVVTDDDALVRVTRQALADCLVVIEHVRARAELDAHASRSFALIVSEAVTEWVTGIEVIRFCGARDTPAVFVADEDSPLTDERVGRLGPHVSLVRRPFDRHELERRILAPFRASRTD